MPEFSHKNYSNGTLFRRKSLGTALDRQLTDRTAEDHHTVAGNVGPEGLATLEQASDLALAHLDDLDPTAGDPPRLLTPRLEAQASSSSATAAGLTITTSMSLPDLASPRANEPKRITLTGGEANAPAAR